MSVWLSMENGSRKVVKEGAHGKCQQCSARGSFLGVMKYNSIQRRLEGIIYCHWNPMAVDDFHLDILQPGCLGRIANSKGSTTLLEGHFLGSTSGA